MIVNIGNTLKKRSTHGFLLMIGWWLISAIAYVYMGAHVATNLAPIPLCFGIFSVSLLFFVLCSLLRIKTLKKMITHNIGKVSVINITTFGCWFLTIYPLKYIEPSVVNSIILGILPLGTLTAGSLFYKHKKIIRFDFISSILIFFGIVFLGYIGLFNRIGINESLQSAKFFILLALIGCIMAGLFLAVNNIFAKKLSMAGFKPIDILSIRFFLIVLISGLFSLKFLTTIYNYQTILTVILIATSLIIIPQLLLQYSISYLEPITISIFVPLLPITIYFMQIFHNKHSASWLLISVISYMSLISLYGIWIRYKNEAA